MLNDFKALRFNSFTFRIVSTTLHPLIVEGIGQATCICTLLSKGWRETKGAAVIRTPVNQVDRNKLLFLVCWWRIFSGEGVLIWGEV